MAVIAEVPTLHFDEASHTYTFGARRVPNVTLIIQPYSGYAGFDTTAMETARQKGKHVHKMIELDIAGTLDEDTLPEWMKPVLPEWRRFVADTGFHAMLSERRVYHPMFRYAGTLDLFGTMRKGPALIDIKRSFLAGHATGMQTAAYLEALLKDPTTPDEVLASMVRASVKRFALRLREDGSYRMQEYDDALDRNDFLAALALHNRSIRYA